MNASAPKPRPDHRLLVAIAADDPVRRSQLAAIVAGGGHAIASVDDADVVLADANSFNLEGNLDGRAVVTLGAAEAGQTGNLPRDAWPAQIDAALRAAAVGLTVRGAGSQQPTFRPLPSADAPLLTPREVEVLAALGDGLSNKEAALRLGISPYTVKFHIESLFRKLDATSRAEAVHKGLRQGLIEL